jgi:hypothetical protein
VTEKCKEQCWNCWTIWMGTFKINEVLNQMMTLRWFAQQTDLTFWILPWWDQEDWTERLNSHFRTKTQEFKSWRSTQERWSTKKLTSSNWVIFDVIAARST